MCGWIFHVRKAVASRDGSQLFGRDGGVTGGAHKSNCSIVGTETIQRAAVIFGDRLVLWATADHCDETS